MKRRKRSLMKTKTVDLVKGQTPPGKFSALVATVVAVALSSGFSMMMDSSFGIGISVSGLVWSSIITSLVFCGIFLFNRKWLSFTALMSAPVMFALSALFDWFGVRKGIMALMYYLKLYVFLWIPGDFPEAADGAKTILSLLIVYDLIAISCTAFVIMKRRWIPAALIPYAPLFLFSVMNTDITPKAMPCLIAGAGVTELLLCHAFRRKKRITYDKVMLTLAVPVLCFMLLLGVMNPQDKYNKNKLAENILIETRDWFDKTAGRNSRLRELFERALNGFETSDYDSSFDAISPLYSTSTNLNKVGPFNPSNEPVFKVYRESNPDYLGIRTLYQGNVLYFKVESSDTYQNNTLSNSKLNKEVYDKSREPAGEIAQYGITVTPIRSMSVDVVPLYSDHFTMNGNDQPVKFSAYNFTRERKTVFPSSPCPVKAGNIYTNDYIDNYVYKTCLEVPYSTDRALINSGKLPGWYLDIYYGRINMSDAEKVKAVTEFVRELHPYDVNTAYPPKGVDFVPWFVNNAESGICVHYAATSMVLLRMIGIPARYVRGYIDVNSMPDSESVVHASNAHAWFEFFVPEYGWIMGDATPGYNRESACFNIEAVASVYPDIETHDFRSTDDPESKSTGSETTTETSEETTSETETVAGNETETSESDTSAIGENGRPEETGIEPGGSSQSGGSETRPDAGNKEVGSVIEFPEYARNFFKIVLTVVICAAFLAVIILVLRAVLLIYWTNRFRAVNINDRAIAYYHYFNMMAKLFRFVFPTTADQIAEKAAFSGKDISSAELDALITSCRKLMKMTSADFSGPKKCFYRLMLMPEIKGK